MYFCLEIIALGIIWHVRCYDDSEVVVVGTWLPWRPVLRETAGVSEQCRCLVATVIGKVLLQQVLASDIVLRKTTLELMAQYIRNGQVSKFSWFCIVLDHR